jgi:phosphatidylserine/phosphatidylglycerophosphate/cardiolipin synthase-like enzyme
MPADLRAAFDRSAAGLVTRSVRGHHRRRLRRLGWESALDATAGGWAAGNPPPRAGNSVDVLIDGAEALPEIAAALESAESHVHIAGWHLSPDFAVTRDGRPIVLRNLLADLAERVEVRVLVWAGAPLPFFRPSRRSVREARERLTRGTRIQCALDSRERPLHCHHEKTIVIDDRTAFVGGIDLTSLAGDRFDTSDHPPRAAVGWHDAGAVLKGPAVGDVAEHFRMRWREVTGEVLPAGRPAQPAGELEAQIVRTIPERIYDAVPGGEFRILESYLRAFRGAQRLVYAENQFLWSPEIAAVLADKLSDPPCDEFRLVLLLPAKPNNGADDTRGVLGELIEADDGDGRLVASTLYARANTARDPIYVHAKIAIVDDGWLTLGSANLNEHSLFNDTEMNVVVRDPGLVAQTRTRLWAEHLELDAGRLPADATEAVDRYWKPIGREQLERVSAGQPLTHRLVELPNLSRRSRRLLGPLDGLLVDG